MKIKSYAILIIVFVVTGCNYIDCNYEKLTNNEYKKIAELNRSAKRVDPMYNDQCLKAFFHVYLKTNSVDLETKNEIIKELRN